MAAKDLNSDDVRKQELDDLTTCCICTEVYTDPKALPCIHTFCMKCIQENGLKTNKGPGDEMPCPICRRMFKIPPEGFRGLPKNFFIEKLMKVANISEPSQTLRALCDACLEVENEGTGTEIPEADAYCVNCKHKLCEECSSEHRKFKLTRNHKLIPLTEHEGGQNVMTNLAPSVCELHEQKVLDVYCVDCKTVLCAICFIDKHKNHEGSDVKKFVDGFREQIESTAEALNKCRSKAEMKNAELLKVKEAIQERVENLENDVGKRKDELKQYADKHAASLLQGLCLIRQSKLKEIQMESGDIDTYLSCLDNFSSYCQKVMAKGSATDICREFFTLSVRAVELQQQCQPTIEKELPSFELCFRKLELEENYENLIGEIEEEGDWKPKKRSEESILEEVNTYKMTLRTLEDQVEKLKQQLETTKTDNRNKILDLEEKLRHNENEKQQLTVTQTEEKQRLLETLRFKSDPVLVQTIRTKAAEEEKKSIIGLTMLDKELFVVSHSRSEVEVYDSIKVSSSRRWNLKELMYPADIRSCNRNKCLYIFDYKGFDQAKDISRVDTNGNLKRKWSTGYDYGRLSVTNESTVILTVYDKNKLNEYSPDGQFIRDINLSSDAGICNPWHAIKLTNGNFVVSHGWGDDDLHRVCVVDADGKLKKSFGGTHGSTIGQTNHPVDFSVDGNGFVMVADRDNSRVLILDSDLKFIREIRSKEETGRLQRPTKVVLDESHGRLFVADNKFDFMKGQAEDGRIFVFDFK